MVKGCPHALQGTGTGAPWPHAHPHFSGPFAALPPSATALLASLSHLVQPTLSPPSRATSAAPWHRPGVESFVAGPQCAAAAAGHSSDWGLHLDPCIFSVGRSEVWEPQARCPLQEWPFTAGTGYSIGTALPRDRLWVLGLGSEWPIVQKEGQWPLCSPHSRIQTLPQRCKKMWGWQVPQSRVTLQSGMGTPL